MKLWCCVSGEVKHWNLVSNKLIRFKFPASSDEELMLETSAPWTFHRGDLTLTNLFDGKFKAIFKIDISKSIVRGCKTTISYNSWKLNTFLIWYGSSQYKKRNRLLSWSGLGSYDIRKWQERSSFRNCAGTMKERRVQ